MSFEVDVLVPCYKRPEYTTRCIKALEEAQIYDNALFHLWDDGSADGTEEILRQSSLNKRVVVNERNMGLRNVLINFIELSSAEFICVVGNDCLMPKNWMNDMLAVFEKNQEADILSPDVTPSHAALRMGEPDTEGKGYMRSSHVGGLWFMRRKLVEGMSFERYDSSLGIRGAFEVLNQIILEKEPKIGWVPSVVVEDMGHWSGQHKLCIKSEEHKQYYAEIGRRIAWQ
jgi:glycosyltransferase involved in cell wall biosynthesis